jgi:hypothetical protein
MSEVTPKILVGVIGNVKKIAVIVYTGLVPISPNTSPIDLITLVNEGIEYF